MQELADALSTAFINQHPTGIAVGLSGGPDSWALALLAHDYATAHHIPFAALTVDHRLRPESTDEAAAVHAACTQRGIPHHTLVWQHDGIDTRKQERARAARYALMGDWCAAYHMSHLLTAHHADDQAETVLLRLAKGSGVTGLAGIAPSRRLNQTVTLLRPLLAVPKADLIAYAETHGIPFINDPSNDNPDYARVRLRQAAAVLEREGLTRDNLLKLATTAREEHDALTYAADLLLLADWDETDNGISLPADPWLTAPPALRRLAFLTIWRQVTGAATYQPRREEIDALCTALVVSGTKRTQKRTLGGMICSYKNGLLTFTLENPRENTGEKTSQKS